MTRFLILVSLLFAMTLHADASGMGGGPLPEVRDEIAPADRDEIDRAIREDQRLMSFGALDEPAQYTFFPMSGIPGYDLFLSNAVDLDNAASAIKDFDCSGATYDGHLGHDMLMLTFRQQDVGTPVYAALDGVVTATHDGEPDRNIVWQGGVRANYVVLRHGPMHHSIYYHFRKGSVAVVPNQTVSAGTQIGLAASSGFSNWPHLHFESRNANGAFEPSAGPCRPGKSYWAQQPAIGGALFVRDFSMSPQPYESFAALPEDPAPRTGSFVRGSAVPVNFRMFLGNLPAASSYRIRIVRPDGSIAWTREGTFNNFAVYRLSFWWWSFLVDLNVSGPWTVKIDVNGTELVAAPFEAVASASAIVNRAPAAVTAKIVPAIPTADDVTRCEVSTSLAYEDPDYDVMSYRYEWTVAGHIVRDVISAELTDVLPKGTARLGDIVTCRVTPGDGLLTAPPVTVQSLLPGPKRRASRH